MLEKQDIYQYDQKLAAYTKKIKSGNLNAITKKQLLEYKEHLFIKGISKPRILKYLEVLSIVAAKIEKEFSDLTKKDVERFISYLQQKDYSPWTKQTYKVMLRRFMTWLNNGEMPETVSWIKVNISRAERKLPGEGELINEDEIKNAMSMCQTVRDRCLLSVLYESGCRIGEVASMRMGNIVFDNYGVVITVVGKTGARKIRLIQSTAYLKMYIENHPHKDNPNAVLWIQIGNKKKGQPMMYPAFRKVLKTLFLKAGVNKRCNPHMFRHSRATYMANHLTEFQMNQYFGWIQGSNMPSTYVHLSGRDVEKAVLAMNGLTPKKEDETPKPIKCPRCEFINQPDSKNCIRCYQILTETEAIKHDQLRNKQAILNTVMDRLIKKPSVQQLLLQEVSDMGLNSDILEL